MRNKPKGMDSEFARRFMKVMGGVNVGVFKLTGGRIAGNVPGQGHPVPICVLTHTGRRSGTRRETPLVYLADGEQIVVVASQGGRPQHPAWYLNLTANPDVEVRTRRGNRPMRARTADPVERSELWPRLVALYGDYANYQSWCPREIPVVVLDPR
jgi:deazaflavin-dependent oxidoreductase (nitroreductase family)